MIDIFKNGSFNIISFRTMEFNIYGKSSKFKIINDLTLKDNRDSIGKGVIDRIYASWIIFDKNKYNLYKIIKYQNNTLYAEKVYTSTKIIDIPFAIAIIKNIEPKTKIIYHNTLYSYKFFTARHKHRFFDYFNCMNFLF